MPRFFQNFIDVTERIQTHLKKIAKSKVFTNNFKCDIFSKTDLYCPRSENYAGGFRDDRN